MKIWNHILNFPFYDYPLKIIKIIIFKEYYWFTMQKMNFWKIFEFFQSHLLLLISSNLDNKIFKKNIHLRLLKKEHFPFLLMIKKREKRLKFKSTATFFESAKKKANKWKGQKAENLSVFFFFFFLFIKRLKCTQWHNPTHRPKVVILAVPLSSLRH